MEIILTRSEYGRVLLAPKTNFIRKNEILNAITKLNNDKYLVNGDLLLDPRARSELSEILGVKL